MGRSIERRIEALERALAEEAAGDSRRRIALEELEESVKRRIRAREGGR